MWLVFVLCVVYVSRDAAPSAEVVDGDGRSACAPNELLPMRCVQPLFSLCISCFTSPHLLNNQVETFADAEFAEGEAAAAAGEAAFEGEGAPAEEAAPAGEFAGGEQGQAESAQEPSPDAPPEHYVCKGCGEVRA